MTKLYQLTEKGSKYLDKLEISASTSRDLHILNMLDQIRFLVYDGDLAYDPKDDIGSLVSLGYVVEISAERDKLESQLLKSIHRRDPRLGEALRTYRKIAYQEPVDVESVSSANEYLESRLANNPRILKSKEILSRFSQTEGEKDTEADKRIHLDSLVGILHREYSGADQIKLARRIKRGSVEEDLYRLLNSMRWEDI